MFEYTADDQGIDVDRIDERGTFKTCSVCGTDDGRQRVERGLYVCDSCGTVANADINGAENIRQKGLPCLASDGGDRPNGWMAQPAVHLFAGREGRLARENSSWTANTDLPTAVGKPRRSRRGGCHSCYGTVPDEFIGEDFDEIFSERARRWGPQPGQI